MKQNWKKIVSLCMALCLMIMPFFTVKASAAEKSKDIVLILDTSGSMSGKAITNLKTAAVSFCTQALAETSKLQIAIVTINSQASKITDLTSDLSVLTEKINGLRASGGTNIYNALDISDSILDNSSADRKYMVVMTDGLPEHGTTQQTGKYTAYDHSYCYQQANACLDIADPIKKKCSIYTVGFFESSSAADAAFGERFLKDLASSAFFILDSLDDLLNTFKDIAEEIVTPKEEQNLTLNIDKNTKIMVGDTKQIKVKGSKTNLTYSSSDETIATVDDKGLITGVKAGPVEITVVAEGDSTYEQAWVTVPITITPEKISIKDVSTKTSGDLKIKLTQVTKGITGYQVQYKVNGKTESVKIKNSGSSTISLKRTIFKTTVSRPIGGSSSSSSKQTIQVRVRTYTETRGKTYTSAYTSWQKA